MVEPLVFFIDIDGTLIGDVTPQVCEWEIVEAIDKSKITGFRNSLVDVLVNGLLRPQIADFIIGMKQRYDHVEFYVFTASDVRWANFVVPCIEKAIGFKFNRPIFTRENCIDQKKSLDCIIPKVVRGLKKKYPKISMRMLRSRVALIDNNDVLVPCESHRCIRAPTYSFIYYNDVLSKLSLADIERGYITIATIMYKYGLIDSKVVHDPIKMRASYYTCLGKKVHEEKNQHSKDYYWTKLFRILQALHFEDLKSSTIKKINKAIKRELKLV